MRISKSSIYTILCAGFLLTACKKGYMDLSSNPNQVQEPTMASLLTTATHKTGINNYNAAGLTNPYVQYTASPSPGSTADIYQEVDGSNTWNAIYFAMADIWDMKDIAIKSNNTDYQAIANVLLAYHLNLVIDLWGDAPYATAFNRSTLTPTYDKQEDLYTLAMGLLDTAIMQLRLPDGPIKLNTTNDLIYGAAGAALEKTKWRRFAFAQKARMLLKVSKQASYNAAAVLSAVDSSFTNNSDDAGMKFFAIRNPWANVSRLNAGLTLGGWLSEQFVDHLSGKTYGVFDPRIRKITEPTVTGTWVGTVNGAGNKGPANNTVKDEVYISYTAGPWTADTSSLWLATYAEMKFIEAEAALATDPTRAYNAYIAGITANMDKLQVPAGTERTDYMTAAAVGAANLTRDLIMKEKYVALYLNPEAWNDARRYDYKYKDFTLPVSAVLPDFIRRMPYPQDERSKNGKNIPGTPALTDKIFWDK